MSFMLAIVMILSFSGLGLMANTSYAQEPDQNSSVSMSDNSSRSSDCISYTTDEENGKNTITVSCSNPTTLTDIYNSINNPEVLKREDNSNHSTWILDATIVVEKGSTLVIN